MPGPTLLSEKILLENLKAGSEGAFEILYKQYSKRIYRKIFSMVKLTDTADELTQTLFVKIWDKRTLIDPEQNFESYLYQVTQNLVMDFYRKVKRDRILQDQIISLSTELYSHVEENIFYKQSKQVIDKAIDQLPSQQQQVFRLCKIDGKSHEEISELLGISRSTVSNHITQAHKTIKTIIFENERTAMILITAILFHRLE